MGYGFKVEVWGEYALFSRPELKVERFSYGIITPSAARGILESIFWKPAIVYRIDEIAVCSPIKFANIRRNELKSKLSASNARTAMTSGDTDKLYISAPDDITQRASTLLKDVRYVITAHFDLTEKTGERDSPEKFYNIILRRLRNGQNHSMPYFGTRECTANIRLIEEGTPAPPPIDETRDLGLMLYDMAYGDEIVPTFFRASMVGGVVDLRGVEVLR
ncbi:MAG: type I-C CRISPR-associated protein Cas5c [Oscillospiraceae bacterium]|jgi:CRISPR-associated protein Cas5d|nr:type I-C CRISPR-associated protein Cas5c [Oscillospiraceae bacterium]